MNRRATLVFAGLTALAVSSSALGGIKIKDGDTVAFLGDSITAQGQDRRNPDGYVNRVIRALDCEGVKVTPVKAGISGHKSNDMLARLNRQVLARKPRWMTLSCGVNDVWHQDHGKGVALEDYRKNISAILDTCAASNCTVIVMTATPFTQNACKDPHNEKLAPYNAWLREEAVRRNLPLADVNAALRGALEADPKARLTRDGVHMLPAGDRLMAMTILKAMGVEDAAFARIERDAWKDVWVLCRFDLKTAADRPAYIAAVKDVLANVRAEPGCIAYTLLGDAETEWTAPQRSGDQVLWMIEHWDCLNSLKAHLDMPHMKAFGPKARELRSGNTFQVFEDVAR